MTEPVYKKLDLINLLKTCATEIQKPEYRKPLIATSALAISVFGITFAIGLFRAGYEYIIKIGLISVEVMNTAIGVCVCLTGVYLFLYFMMWPASVCLRLFKSRPQNGDNKL